MPKRKPPDRFYQIYPYDHPKRWLCVKKTGEAYLVELDFFGSGQHLCGCLWFEFHKWDSTPIKPCIHIKRVLTHIKKINQ
jgi:hypothetical protein